MLSRLLVATLLTTSMAPLAATQSAPPSLAVPVEPIAAVLDAFRTYDIVALSDRQASCKCRHFSSHSSATKPTAANVLRQQARFDTFVEQ